MTREQLLGTPREWAQDLAFMAAVGAFLGVIGPFGSYHGGPIEVRVPYWIGNLCIGYAVLALFVRGSAALARRYDVPSWIALGFSVAVGAAPLAILIQVFSGFAWPAAIQSGGDRFGLYLECLAISEPLAFLFNHLRVAARGGADAPSPPAPPALAPPSAGTPAVAKASAARVEPPPAEVRGSLFARLPPRLGRELLCLEMEDHYVRAHTALGSDLVLMPLRDAVDSLGSLEGLQVHRSFWVAREAVAGPIWRGRNLALRLVNGREVPVSRASIAKLKAAGWIEDSG